MGSLEFTPALLEDRTYTSSQRRGLIDAGFMISAMLLVLMLIPAPIVFGAIGAMGRPGVIMAVGMFAVWALSRTHPRLVIRGPQPLRWFAVFFFTSTLASYAAALFRGMPSAEQSGSEMALLATVGFTGTMLVVADCVPTKARLGGVIRVMLFGGGIMALIGIIQATTHFDITEYIQIPGLEYHGKLSGFEARGAGLYRVASTAGHYIEFATVMALLLPFAVHMGRFAPTRAQRQWSTIAGAMMFAVIPMTLSRTGVVALVVVLLVMIPAWNWRTRFNLLFPVLLLTGMLMMVMPGLLGTLLSLFTNVGNDPSIQTRTSDYEAILPYLDGKIWFGRGQGTFIPQNYLFLDNQWLGQLVGGGVIGLLALATLHIGTITLAGMAYYRSTDPADRHLCACLVAAQMLAVAVGWTFDSLGFSTYALTLSVLTGAAAVMWRVTRAQPHATKQEVKTAHDAAAAEREAQLEAARIEAAQPVEPDWAREA